MSELIIAQQLARPILQRMLRNSLDDVDDVLQNAAINALEKAEQFRGDAKFSTWFTRIAIRAALMHMRTNRRKKDSSSLSFSIEESNFDIISKEESPEHFAIRRQREERLREKVASAIAVLTPAKKNAAQRWLQGEKTASNAEKSARHQARGIQRESLKGV